MMHAAHARTAELHGEMSESHLGACIAGRMVEGGSLMLLLDVGQGLRVPCRVAPSQGVALHRVVRSSHLNFLCQA